MVTLRQFRKEDAESVRRNLYPDMTADEIAAMIDEWNTGVYQNRRFEMFAVLSDDRIVGYVSLYAISQSAVSAGAEIFRAERGKGYASEAMRLLTAYASEQNCRMILDQVRTDNQASIRLHDKLGFETDGSVFRNRRGHEVYLCFKLL